MHAEGATTVFAKSAKRTRKLTKYGFFGTFAPFLCDVSMTSSGGSGSDDVSMTSSGDVAAYEWSTGAVRWQTGGAMVDGGCRCSDDAGSDAALMLAGGLAENRKPRRYHIGLLLIWKGIYQRGL